MAESEKFRFSGVLWNYVHSQEIGSTEPPMIIGIRAVDVHCKACGKEWRATEHGIGRFRPSIEDATGIECPQCGASEWVTESAFGAKPQQ